MGNEVIVCEGNQIAYMSVHRYRVQLGLSITRIFVNVSHYFYQILPSSKKKVNKEWGEPTTYSNFFFFLIFPIWNPNLGKSPNLIS